MSPGRCLLPKVVAHDKGPQFVNSPSGHVAGDWAHGLNSVGMTSWVEDGAAWLASDFADCYLHESVNGAIHYGLQHWYPARRPLKETRSQFARRIQRVVSRLNREHKDGLGRLAGDFLVRCEEVIRVKGKRLPK